MDEIVYRDPAVIKFIVDYIALKVNGETENVVIRNGEKDAAAPTMLLLTADQQSWRFKKGLSMPRFFWN